MNAYWSRVLELAVPCLVFWGILAISVASDRSKFRNCIYLLMAVLSSAPLFCALFGTHQVGAARALSILVFACLLSVPVILMSVLAITPKGNWITPSPVLPVFIRMLKCWCW